MVERVAASILAGYDEPFMCQFMDNGFLVLEGFLDPDECDALRERMKEIVEKMDVPKHCRVQFSTDHDEQLKTQVLCDY